jgi:hypothetical protein
MAGDAGDDLDTDYPPEEQAEWDELSEHDRIADVTGVGPHETDEDEESES